MKWVDYREKLKIGFDDRKKFEMLSAILKNYVGNIVGENFDEDSYFSYCQMVGEAYKNFGQPNQHLKGSLDKAESLYELVAKYIAFCNTYSAQYTGFALFNSSSETFSVLITFQFF